MLTGTAGESAGSTAESCQALPCSVETAGEEDERAEAAPATSDSSEPARLVSNSSSLGLEKESTVAGGGDGEGGGGEGGGGEGGEGGGGNASGLPSTAPAASAALGALWGPGGVRWAGGRLGGVLADLSLRRILQSLAQQERLGLGVGLGVG